MGEGVKRINPQRGRHVIITFQAEFNTLPILYDTSLSPLPLCLCGPAPGEPKMTRYPFVCCGSIIAAFPPPRCQAPMNNEWRAACINVAAWPPKERTLAGELFAASAGMSANTCPL